MKQVVQSVRGGATRVTDVPDPVVQPGQVLVATAASLISAGTEKYVVDLAQKSLLGKAKARPDQVRRVLQKIREEGLRTVVTQVQAKLDETMPLGYSSAGIVIACGRGVRELKPGDRVATAAPHAGIVSVPHNLVARIPDNVTFEQAAYTSVAAIALEGIRLANVTLGSRVLVVGLGLIGQLAVMLLKAHGCRVFGTDVDPKKLARAKELGADEVGSGAPIGRVKAFSEGAGVDAAIITAATPSNEPIEFCAEACRVKGRIVLVGVVGLNLPRPPFFAKELEFTVSSSLGAGRGDTSYEDKGIDYPIGYARWTAQRNMQAVLDTIGSGALRVDELTTHRFPIDDAGKAYELIQTNAEPFFGIVLQYPDGTSPRMARIATTAKPAPGANLGVSLIGAGNFARLVMIPALSKIDKIRWRGIVSARGLNAAASAGKLNFEFAATDVREVFDDPDTHAVFIATRHDLHAPLVIEALRAGKHVFVEKPLCIRFEELDAIRETVASLGADCPVLTVGFNRRFAPATMRVKQFFDGIAPLMVTYRFAAPSIPPDVWVHDEEVGGGRIIGEASHAIDLCAHLAGSRPLTVFCESMHDLPAAERTDDRAFITVRHDNGSITNIAYAVGGDGAFPAERIETFGGGRTAVIEHWNDMQLWRGGKMEKASGGGDRGHAAEFAAFIEGCRGGKWPIAWDDLDAVTWAALAAQESIRTGESLSRT